MHKPKKKYTQTTFKHFNLFKHYQRCTADLYTQQIISLVIARKAHYLPTFMMDLLHKNVPVSHASEAACTPLKLMITPVFDKSKCPS